MIKCPKCGKQIKDDRVVCPFCKRSMAQEEEKPAADKTVREVTFGYAALAFLSLFPASQIIKFTWLNKLEGSIAPLICVLLIPLVMNVALAVTVRHVEALGRVGKTILTVGALAMVVLSLLIAGKYFFLPYGIAIPKHLLFAAIIAFVLYTYLAVRVILIVKSINQASQTTRQGIADDVRPPETGAPGRMRSSSSGDGAYDAKMKLEKSISRSSISDIGFGLALIGIIATFIPLVELFAVFIAVSAVIIAAIGLAIAFYRKAKKTFAWATVALSLIGMVISGAQFINIVPPKQKVNVVKRLQGVLDSVSSTLSARKPETPEFSSYWSSRQQLLKSRQYEQFFSDALLWPIDGYPYFYRKSKNKLIAEWKETWAGYGWENSEVKKDESKNNVWTVKFSSEETELEYTLIGHSYRLTGFYNMAIGRKVEDRSTGKADARDPVSAVKNGTLGFNTSVTIGQALDRYSYFNNVEWNSFQAGTGEDIVNAIGSYQSEIVLQSAVRKLSEYETDYAIAKIDLGNLESEITKQHHYPPDVGVLNDLAEKANSQRSLVNTYWRKINYTKSFITYIKTGERKIMARTAFVLNTDNSVSLKELCISAAPSTGGINTCIEAARDADRLNEIMLSIYNNQNIYNYECPEDVR